VVDEGRVLVLLRPGRGEVRLPKGHVEPGETAQDAALRETAEESGYAHLVLQGGLGEQIVAFQHGGRHVVRTEYYFLMTLAEGPPALPANGEDQFRPTWVEWGRALEMLTFEPEREWVRRARAALEQRTLAVLAAGQKSVALSTGSLYTYGIARVFHFAAEAGYDGVEVLVDHRWDTRQTVYLRRLVSEYGLPILALHSPFVATVPGWPRDQLGRLRETVGLAGELGVGIVVTHLPFRVHSLSIQWHGGRSRTVDLPVPRLRRDAYARFLCEDLSAFEEASGVTVAVENMPARRFLGLKINRFWCNSLEELGQFRHVTLDATHLGTWGSDVLAAYSRLRGQVVHVHLSNYDGREHRLPNSGDLPLGVLLQQLAAGGFVGTVTVECSPSAFGAESPARALAAAQQALAFVRRNLKSG
jgi:sugar phosphate isomerase/epimerase/8-oxo-dGTP pyrophosphatase MutT (NUDIX family)